MRHGYVQWVHLPPVNWLQVKTGKKKKKMENILFSSWCTSMHSFLKQGLTDLFIEQELIKLITEKPGV
jgi:hypothetical protein